MIALAVVVSVLGRLALGSKCDTFLDTFDSATGLTGVIPELSPVNVSATGALQYHALDYVTGPGQIAVQFPSPPNVIGAGSLSIPREGHMPSWNLKPGSKYTSFNQRSLAYICVTNLQNSVSPPTSCNIQAAGRKIDGSFVYHTLIFNAGPNDDIPGNFSAMTFPKGLFDGLVEMNMAIVYANEPVTIIAMIYDNNGYEACY